MNDAIPRSAPPPNMAPIDVETDAGPLPLKGTLPAGLRGTLVRNGPNPVRPDPKEHWFAGDGMLHAFSIGDGKVHYRNRWVRTQRWHAAAEGQDLPGGFQEALLNSGQKPPHDDGSANTNVIGHAGRVLALEEAHLPVEVALPTLATLGANDFGGGLQGSSPRTPRPTRRPASCCSSATARRRRCPAA
jgi:carotenoid cleavage dioxygenase-like enzyme